MYQIIIGFCLCALWMTGCTQKAPDTYQGYVEGEYVNISSSQSGRLDKLFVKRGMNVASGDPLFTLDSANETALLHQNESELDSARASLSDMQKGSRPEEIEVIKAKMLQAKADALYYQGQLKRNQALYKEHAVSKEILESTAASSQRTSALVLELEHDLKVAQLGTRKDQIEAQKGKISQIEALIAQSLWRLSEKALKAPSNAMVFDTLYREGEFVPSGGIVVRLLPPQNRKIRFFVPQNIVKRLSTNQKVLFSMMDNAKSYEGTITFISPEAEYTPPLIYSNESKERLVFMVEAYPKSADATLFHPGEPIQVTIDASKH
ncbi:MAG: HlyD family secretion protein [Sulfuricurvum sp.]|uniref:HlyD family secretion protein n=2 Tax=Sulfuricurvum sp. TaxID=2025608 RepID=UPI00262AACB3|nr:HlyD family efflux transporter periplasmic adaptor subunit [uncultured Sulfuricurvum sp.]